MKTEFQNVSQAQLKKWARLDDNKFRCAEGIFLAEGVKVVDELLSSDWQTEALLVLSEKIKYWEKLVAKADRNIPVYQVTGSELKKLSQDKEPEGIMAIAVMPREISSSSFLTQADENILILQEINNPNNLGALLRSALWFGFNNVIISGTNFITGQTAVNFSGSGVTASNVNVTSATQLTATITTAADAAPGARDVSVTTAGGTGTLNGGFTVNQAAPIVTGVNPNSGMQGQTISNVIIAGTYFTGTTSVRFGALGSYVSVNSFLVDNDTQITANITILSYASPGTRNVTVTTPWGTNGIRAYWQGEAASAVASKPVLGLATLRLKKLMALVPTTDELLDDANALTSYLPEKVALSIRWKTNESILFGAGNGVPIGALAAGATVTVAKESGQATQTLQAQNLAKMIARLPAGSFANAVWIVNNDVLPALFTLTLGNYPIYLPMGMTVGGIQSSPYARMLACS